MASADEETSRRLLQVISILYSRSISTDYRKPIQHLHPEIAATYYSIIKHPMDLGTLLLECMNSTATVRSIRDGLKQIFANSIRFNVNDPKMEAICRHLKAYATGIFEETLRIQFNDKISPLEDFSKVLII